MRDPGRGGLDWFSLETTEAARIEPIAAALRVQGATVTPIADGIEATDPWGTRLRVVSVEGGPAQ